MAGTRAIKTAVIALIIITLIFNIKTSLLARSPPFFTLEEMMEDMHLYRGDFHSHTSYSDGVLTPKDAYAYAKNAGLDFFAITDHALWLDTYRDYVEHGFKSTEWPDIKAQANAALTDNFTAFHGFEWTSSNHGHMNAWFTEDYVESTQTPNGPNKKTAYTLSEWYGWIKEHPEALSQFNHPTWGDQYESFSYDQDVDPQVVTLEVWNSQTTSDYWEAFHLALDKGWHVAGTACQDNHEANWGNANNLRTYLVMKKHGRDEVRNALINHRVFATNDSTAYMVVKFNGELMGSYIHPEEKGNGERILLIEAAALEKEKNDDFSQIEVVSNGGRVVLRENLTSEDANHGITKRDANGLRLYWTAEIPITGEDTTPNGEKWFYVRLIQKDGNILLGAPVWISM